MREQFKRVPCNNLIKKTKYLQHSIIRKWRIRHLMNSFDVFVIKGFTVHNWSGTALNLNPALPSLYSYALIFICAYSPFYDKEIFFFFSQKSSNSVFSAGLDSRCMQQRQIRQTTEFKKKRHYLLHRCSKIGV